MVLSLFRQPVGSVTEGEEIAQGEGGDAVHDHPGAVHDGRVVAAGDLQAGFFTRGRIDGLLLHVTARGRDEDCVSRSFAPKLSVAEDPVCGSGHCHIIPYWADSLGKDELVACQASRRGGIFYCRRDGERIFMAGKAALYAISELFVE